MTEDCPECGGTHIGTSPSKGCPIKSPEKFLNATPWPKRESKLDQARRAAWAEAIEAAAKVCDRVATPKRPSPKNRDLLNIEIGCTTAAAVLATTIRGLSYPEREGER